MVSERILVLDDDDLIRDVISERLERRGFDVARAASLEEARQRIRDGLPDVALLDIRLPDGLGTDLMAELVQVATETDTKPPTPLREVEP